MQLALPPRPLERFRKFVETCPNGVVFFLHTLLAGFVAFRAYPATQDGPAHLYTTHVLASLARDENSPYAGVFESNLGFATNKLFYFIGVWLDSVLPAELIAGLTLFAGLVTLPLSALAFERALRQSGTPGYSDRLPVVSATLLACPLAYNYFLYRGLFNYVLGIPCAIACLAAMLKAGDENARPGSRMLFGALSLAAAVLAALAHPSALVFLVAAVFAANLKAPRARRIVGGLVLAALFTFLLMSPVGSNSASFARTIFSSPVSSLMRIVRSVGVTHSWWELIFALSVIGLLVSAAARALSPLRSANAARGTAWPALLATALMVVYFFVPFEYGGAAGLNERIVLFAAVLVLPLVPLTLALRRWLPLGFAVFAAYTAASSVRYNAAADAVRRSAAANQLPRGSHVYPIVLQMKLGSLSADLGRHVLSDIARERQLVIGRVFCGHPAHAVRCTELTPKVHDDHAIEAFELMNDSQRRAALADPASPIRSTFRHIVELASGYDYLLVSGSPLLDAAFEEHVIRPLGARPLHESEGPLRVYRPAQRIAR